MATNKRADEKASKKAPDKREKKNKKDSQLVIRLNRELRDRFVDLCDELDTSAARELRGFMKEFVRRHEKQDK
ncbi:MAG: hypothetical protein AAFW68_10730 [Pseudomonadota bacterium]